MAICPADSINWILEAGGKAQGVIKIWSTLKWSAHLILSRRIELVLAICPADSINWILEAGGKAQGGLKILSTLGRSATIGRSTHLILREVIWLSKAHWIPFKDNIIFAFGVLKIWSTLKWSAHLLRMVVSLSKALSVLAEDSDFVFRVENFSSLLWTEFEVSLWVTFNELILYFSEPILARGLDWTFWIELLGSFRFFSLTEFKSACIERISAIILSNLASFLAARSSLLADKSEMAAFNSVFEFTIGLMSEKEFLTLKISSNSSWVKVSRFLLKVESS